MIGHHTHTHIKPAFQKKKNYNFHTTQKTNKII